MTSRDIVCNKIHFRHDPKWSRRLGPVEGGGLLLCVACLIEMIDNEDIASVRKSSALSSVSGVLKCSPGALRELLQQDHRVCLHFTAKLLGMLQTAEDPVTLEKVDQVLVQLLLELQSELSFRFVLDEIHKQLTEQLSVKHFLPTFSFLGNLIKAAPTVSQSLVTHYVPLLDRLCSALLFPDEALKGAVVYVWLQLLGAPGGSAAQSLPSAVRDRVCNVLLKTLANASSPQLLRYCVGLLSQLVHLADAVSVLMNSLSCQVMCDENEDILANNSQSLSQNQDQQPPDHCLLPLILKKLLLSGDENLQVTSAKCIASVLVHSPSQYSAPFINADVPEFLFDRLACSSNEVLLWSAYSCLLLLTEEPLFFSQCHSVYGMESLVRSLKESLQLTNLEVPKQGLLLLREILERQPASVRLFPSGAGFVAVSEVLVGGVSSSCLLVATQAASVTSALFRLDHQSRPVQYEAIIKLIEAITNRFVNLTLPSPAHLRSSGRMKRSDPSSQALRSERFLLQALVCFHSACRLAEECASDPVLKENTFTAPYKHSGAQDSLESLCQCLLRCCDAVWIPTVIRMCEHAPSAPILQNFYSILSSQFTLLPSLMPAFANKLASSGFYRLAVEHKGLLCAGNRNPNLNASCCGFLQKLSMCLLSQSDLPSGSHQHDLKEVENLLLHNLPSLCYRLSEWPSVLCEYQGPQAPKYCLVIILYLALQQGDRLLPDQIVFSNVVWLLRSVQEQGCVPPHSVLRSALYLLALTQDKSPSLDGASLNCISKALSSCQSFSSLYFHHPALIHFMCRYPELAEKFAALVLELWLTKEQDTNTGPTPADTQEEKESRADERSDQKTDTETMELLSVMEKYPAVILTLLDMVCTREAPLAERVLGVLEVLLGGQRGYNINLCTKLRPALLQALQRVSVVNTDHGFEQEYAAQVNSLPLVLKLLCVTQANDPPSSPHYSNMEGVHFKLLYHVSNVAGRLKPIKTESLLPAISYLYCCLSLSPAHCTDRAVSMLLSNSGLMDQLQTVFSSSSSSSSSSAGKGTKSSSSSGYSSGSSASSSRTPHTPPSASSTSSSSSSSSATSGAHPSNSIPTSTSSAAPSRQQPPPQPAPPPPAPQQQPPATSTSAPQSLPKSCLSGYGSPVPPVKTPTSALTGQTPPQQQTQSYSPNQPPTSHLAQSYGGFSSPQAQDLSSGTGGKGYGSLGGRSQSYSTDLYGTDSAYGSLPSSLGGAGSPSLGYGAPGHSPALLRSSGSSGSGASGGGSSSGTGSGNSGSGGGAGNGLTNERGGGGSGGASYHIPDSSPSPSGNSGIIRPGLHSPVPNCPTQSPGGPGSNKYISSVLSPTFLASPQGFPDTRGPSSQPQSYHSTSSKTKADTSMLGVGSQRSQEEVDDDDEFLIQHLLQAQASPAPQAAHHHPQQQPQQTSQQTQPQPQSVPPTTDSGKGMSYDMSKTPEERYHPQSVIRTHSATTTAGVGNAGSGGSISGLDSQLEMSLKKQQQQHQQHHHQQQQQQRNERSVGSSRSSGGRGSAEQVHSHLHHHDNLGSVVHYGRGDPYTQHSLAPQHSSHTQHVSSHSQIPPHTQMELQKKPQERAEIPYPRKTPEIQQQHSQSQAAASLMDSPTDQSRQPPHLLQSVLSHTTRNKMEPHPQHHKMDSHRQHQQHHKMDSHPQHQQHPKMDSHPQHQQHQKMDSHQHQQHHKIDSHSQHQQHHKMDSLPQQQQHSISQQQAVMDNTGGRLGSSKHQPQSQSQATQLQLQLQSQALEVAAAHYNHGPPPHQHEQSQVKQSSVVSSLDMLERSLSQTSSTDVAVAEDRRGGPGSAGRSGASGERHRQQQQEQQRQHAPHHQPPQTHHSQQHSASELHSFLTEPDIGLSTPSHMHHLSQHHAQQQHPSSQHQQTHSHHPHTQPHPQQPPHPHHIPPPSASALSQPQPDPQQPLSAQLTPQQSQLDQQRSEQHQFDTVSPVEKADQNQQSNRFVPLTSICFPDSLLQDEDRSFFPGMEDMFCAEDYKSSCAGGAGPGQEEMNESHTGQEGMDALKAGQSAGGAGGSSGPSYDIMGHHGGDQGYEPYCHGLDEPTNNTMTLDLDSLKTHELPSTVNTEQLGLIQSQAPAMGMTSNTAGPNNSGAKMSSGPGGTNAGPGSGGLQSPIFCSSRPKKLLKSSSFHLLKERRDPNTLPKKSYAQEYEFEDDEDKADQPADIRLNSRRLPDLLPDLVSSCRKGGGGSGSLSPLMGDIDFYHSSGYSTMGSHTLLPPEGPKKRGRKPTRPKREGPPRPRGRPRIRPMPEPYTPRGMMGEMGGMTVGGGFSVEGRGRGRGRGSRGRGGRREDMYIEMSGKEPDQMHHHHLHQQQQPPQQLHHQPQQQQQQQHEPIPPLKIKLPIGTLSSSDALLRTDSLSGTDPALSDGSVGSAPSLGLSPGPPCSTESTRSQDKIKQKSQMMGEGVDDEGLEERGDEKDSESKAGFVASFLDFLKTGKRHPGLDISPGMEPDNGETSPCKSGGLRSLSPAPPPPPPPPPFGDGEGNGGLALGNCPSPKRLEDELKRNLETLPSFSSDEEDSVGKNQDLQKSISSAISALYDTPQLTSNIQPPLPPPQSQNQPSQGPLTPAMQPPTLSPQPAMHTPHTQPQSNEPDVLQPEDVDMNENKEEEEEEE
ncbi:uncharacterized protein LOC102308223, partial [Haplochromis burtoni]|uniref:uncharacterized protein LOC102308223 n=1 Tax=Haplochromis burtoni TaxID=8153 RepID=UPI001C2D5F31